MTPSENDLLDDLFKEARVDNPGPSDDLMARVLADAAALQPVPTAPRIEAPSLWARALGSIGGWPALSGVAAAGIAGLWIGLAPPDAFDVWVATAMGETTSFSFVDDFAVLEEFPVDG